MAIVAGTATSWFTRGAVLFPSFAIGAADIVVQKLGSTSAVCEVNIFSIFCKIWTSAPAISPLYFASDIHLLKLRHAKRSPEKSATRLLHCAKHLKQTAVMQSILNILVTSFLTLPVQAGGSQFLLQQDVLHHNWSHTTKQQTVPFRNLLPHSNPISSGHLLLFWVTSCKKPQASPSQERQQNQRVEYSSFKGKRGKGRRDATAWTSDGHIVPADMSASKRPGAQRAEPWAVMKRQQRNFIKVTLWFFTATRRAASPWNCEAAKNLVNVTLGQARTHAHTHTHTSPVLCRLWLQSLVSASERVPT